MVSISEISSKPNTVCYIHEACGTLYMLYILPKAGTNAFLASCEGRGLFWQQAVADLQCLHLEKPVLLPMEILEFLLSLLGRHWYEYDEAEGHGYVPSMHFLEVC